MRKILFFAAMSVLVLCGLTISLQAPVLANPEKPRNIILMIGDGMGPNQVISAQLRRYGENGLLYMQTFPVHSMVTTHNALMMTTDSAAATTTLGTGVKTLDGRLNYSPEGHRLRNIREAAQDIGMSTGIISQTRMTHATPAAFASHVTSRSQEALIAEHMIASGTNVMMGGGIEYFLPNSHPDSKRSDSRNLLNEAAASGYQVITSFEEYEQQITTASERVMAILAKDHMTTNPPEPSLAQMTADALRILNENPNGFFLMVEGGIIDMRCHANDLEGSIEQTLKFDDAVEVALAFAQQHGDTLIIVTADHETGGLQLTPTGGHTFDAYFTSGDHTNVPVDMFAFGPGAETFQTASDHVHIAVGMADLLGVEIGHVQRRMSVANAKMIQDGFDVNLYQVIVTAGHDALGSLMYVQDQTRTGGIRVINSSGIPTGSLVEVTGKMSKVGIERVVSATSVTRLSDGYYPVPLSMKSKELAGGDWQIAPFSTAGQVGAVTSRGLNNVGLLVSVYGRVTGVRPSTFTIWDGSAWDMAMPPKDPYGATGVLVSTRGLVTAPVNSYVRVTGVSSLIPTQSGVVPLLVIRTANDVQVLVTPD